MSHESDEQSLYTALYEFYLTKQRFERFLHAILKLKME